MNDDTVTSVTLTSTGAGVTATVDNSPYSIVPSAALGTGLSNYNITYVNGSLTVDPRALTITANNLSKIYRAEATFIGTEFTADGLVNGDTVASVTLTSAGAAADATVDGSPYAVVPSAAVGTGLSNYNIIYVERLTDGEQGQRWVEPQLFSQHVNQGPVGNLHGHSSLTQEPPAR